MKTFLIKDLEQLSGIKAQTIRMWEKRYKILEPQRNTSNIRSYQLSHLKYLLQITLLQKTRLNISFIAKQHKDEIERCINAIVSEDIRCDKAVADLVCAMYAMDTDVFENILNNSVNTWGIDKTIMDIIIPFLSKTGITSYKDSSCEVHFVVTAIRRKLVMGIESHNKNDRNEPTVLLFLPPAEHYDLMLLYMNYILRCKAIRVLYLGTNISMENLHAVIVAKQTAMLCTYISAHKKEQQNTIFKYILAHNPAVKLCVVSDKVKEKKEAVLTNFNFIHFSDFVEFEAFF